MPADFLFCRKLTGSEAVVLPPSKSIAARLLTLRFLAGSDAPVSPLPDCDDTRLLQSAYMAADMSRSSDSAIRVNIGDGAASLRFFLGAAASAEGVRCLVSVSEQLKRRPLDELVSALNAVGGRVSVVGDGDLLVEGGRLEGGELSLSSGVTSQFVSSILMSAPMWRRGVTLRIDGGPLVSRSYVDMTVGLLRRCGVEVECSCDGSVYRVASGYIRFPDAVEVEPDWSAASYFYESALLCGMPVRIAALSDPAVSLQGDSRCLGLFRRIGVNTRFFEDGSALLTPLSSGNFSFSSENELFNLCRHIDFFEEDMRMCPDLVPALVFSLVFSGIPFRITGIAHLRYKECDRLSVIKRNLEQFGIRLKVYDDAVEYDGTLPVSNCGEDVAEINSASDHRMVMSAVPLLLRGYGLHISDVGCVSKSFPGFMAEFGKLGELNKK